MAANKPGALQGPVAAGSVEEARRQVEEGLCRPASADGGEAAMRLGIGLLDEGHPQLAACRLAKRQIPRSGVSKAQRTDLGSALVAAFASLGRRARVPLLLLGVFLRSLRVHQAGEVVVQRVDLPSAVDEEADLVDACCIHLPRDDEVLQQISPLADGRQGRQEPAVAHFALLDIVRLEQRRSVPASAHDGSPQRVGAAGHSSPFHLGLPLRMSRVIGPFEEVTALLSSFAAS
eukprot:scaffold1307_cov200-Pinguiococcus_pyrenoidosus.AAC.136